jgi:hypothetical protein
VSSNIAIVGGVLRGCVDCRGCVGCWCPMRSSTATDVLSELNLVLEKCRLEGILGFGPSAFRDSTHIY